jgi:hypothetical protein
VGRSRAAADEGAQPPPDEDEVVEALETYHAYSTRSFSQPLGSGGDEETMEDVLGQVEQGYEEVEHGVLVETGLTALDVVTMRGSLEAIVEERP